MTYPDDHLSRRELLQLSAAGVLAACTSGWFNALAADAAQAASTGGKHKSCILLWMNGGPSQSHTFDLKPGGEYSAIPTSVPGLQISEYLPRLARQMHHAALIRSMSTGEAVHPRARFLMHNGYRMAGGQNYPAIGCIASAEIGAKGSELPNFVSIDGGSDGNGAGKAFRCTPAYLGPQHAPLLVDDPSQGIANIKPAVADATFNDRFDLVEDADKAFADKYKSEAAAAHKSSYEQALRLMRSEKSRAFEIDRESKSVRDSYGDHKFGRACLLARRLVETGVPFVEVTLGGWDDHGGAGKNVKRRSAYMDVAMAALLQDLSSRGLLDSTLVIWMGEFGRSPGSGSQHFARAWTTFLAGGGVKGGAVVGRTEKTGRDVADRPVSAPDFLATVCTALGINPRKEYTTPTGRPIRIVDKSARPVTEVLA